MKKEKIKELRYIISITSVPSRFKTTLPKVLKKIKESVPDIEIVVSIPKKYRKGWEWNESDLDKIKDLAVLNIVEKDWGPATKLLGGIEWIKKNNLDINSIITFDDDIIISDFGKQIQNLITTWLNRDCIITSRGLKAIHAPYYSGNGLSGIEESYCDGVAGFNGVFYPIEFWKDNTCFDLIKTNELFYLEDDAYFGAVARKLGIKIWSTKMYFKYIALDNKSIVGETGDRKERESLLYKELLKYHQNVKKMKEITFVLTSCGRNDLLERTLDSFFKWNTYPIERYIITEDSADPEVFEECERLNQEKYGGKLEFVFNRKKLGQSRSIDKAYSMVNTEYIFHCEEDWEFYRGGFIEDSIKVLETQPKVIQAWIRPKNDKILNKISPKIYQLPLDVKVRIVEPCSFIVRGANEDGTDMVIKNYIGFSWNPGVKRLSDWQILHDGYAGFEREHLVDHYYRDLGYIVVSLSINDDDGYVHHIGWNRRTENTIH